ncbi:MAG: hypothetical protein KBC22_03190 [Candidatus Pacebacteria bacterium]|nr:hypothetical protein [Candidatus Paceibacterota bacterium]
MSFLQFIEQIIFFPLARYPLVGIVVSLVIFFFLAKAVLASRAYFLAYTATLNKKWVTLEIRIPREIERSPVAMEVFIINALYHSSTGSFWSKHWKGFIKNAVSLELVSFGGSLHFYIYCQAWLKDVIESQLYVQFPQVEIIEVEDYTDRIPPYRSDADWDLYGVSFKQRLSPAYPIKTYRDWGVDKHYESLEVTQQIDPLSSLIEAMSSLRPGEEWWIQIMVQANTGGDWKNIAQKEISNLKQAYSEQTAKSEEGRSASTFTDGEKETIYAIERSSDKHRFDVGIRTIYIARKDAFNDARTKLIRNTYASFASNQLNTLERIEYTGFDNPWEDYNSFLDNKKKERFLEDYRRREYFNIRDRFTLFDFYMKYIDPHDYHTMVLNSEELATIYHLPGRVIQTPGIERLESRKAEPPSNLPT